MNGLELIAAIRESMEEPRLPAILVTADGAMLEGNERIARSEIQVVKKTAGPAALARAVRAALAASRI
jgi:CheY-like chemotaxis protein